MTIPPPSLPLPSFRSHRLRSLVPALSAFALILCASSAHAQARAPQLPSDPAPIDRALGPNAPAYHALMEGRVEDAAGLLHNSLAANPADSAAHQLLCRVYYAQEQADDAIHQCELAAASKTAAPSEASENNLWLGRAYGMKARHAGPLTGFTLARKVQASFARAIDLNPSNLDAIDDLGEYDVEAPMIVGGGDDKAHALADRTMPSYPATAHHLLARLAESNKDLANAEAELKRAIAVHNSPDAWIDLAAFYQAHSRPDDALAAARTGIAADRLHDAVLVSAASVLTEAHRAPDLAERCLRDYLASRSKSDAAPAFKVHIQLSHLLAARGDATDASRELQAASALAPAFAHSASARSAQGF